MKSINCIVSDLDGTIVKEDNTISQVTIDVIEKLRTHSIMFLLCTGRCYEDMRSVFPKHLQLPCILLNGAMFMDANGKVCETYVMDLHDVANIETILLRKHMPCIYFTSKHIYGSGDLHSISSCANTYYTNIAQQEYFSTPIIPVNSYKEIKEDILKIESMQIDTTQVEETKKTLCILPGIQVASSLPFNIEITAGNVNKATMLRKVLKHYNISPEETLYFGDSDNDLEAFQVLPNTIAPENANEQIKQLASDQCASCEEDGVALYIKKNYHR